MTLGVRRLHAAVVLIVLPHDTAVLLIAHGSRLAAANDDLPRLAGLLRQRFPGSVVEIAYLELTDPTIPQAAAACVRQGATRVLLMPYFLSKASARGLDSVGASDV